MAKFFFGLEDCEDIEEAETVMTKRRWIEYMKELGIERLTLSPAKIEIGGDGFYCKSHDFIGGRGFDYYCGKICESYAPRNGKNGICKHYRNLYVPTDGEKIVLTLNELK